jgi:hypothetical protein
MGQFGYSKDSQTTTAITSVNVHPFLPLFSREGFGWVTNSMWTHDFNPTVEAVYGWPFFLDVSIGLICGHMVNW